MPPEGDVHVGTDRKGNPVFVPARTHWQVRGGTGKGKSSLITYVLLQLIHLFHTDYIVVVDFGKDLALHNICKGAANAAGRVFREFTIGLSSAGRYFLDPIAACATHGSVPEIAEAICIAIGLAYGAGYGKSFHSAVNLETIARALERLIRSGLPITLQSLAAEIGRSKEVRSRDVSEASLLLQNLARLTQLHTFEDPSRQLTPRSGFEQRSIDYISAATMRASSIPIAVGTAAFTGVINEAVNRRDEELEDIYAHLLCDEASIMNGARSLEMQLPYVRKWAGLKFLHQFTSQWYENGKYFPDSLRSNCPVRILFGADTKEDFEDLQLASDDVIETFRSRSGATLDNLRITEQERLLPGLSANDIREVNRSGEAFFTGNARKGDPLIFRMCYPTVSPEEHERLSRLSVKDESEQPKPAPTKSTPAFNSERQKERRAAIEASIEKYAEAESFDVSGDDAAKKADS